MTLCVCKMDFKLVITLWRMMVTVVWYPTMQFMFKLQHNILQDNSSKMEQIVNGKDLKSH